MVITAFRVILLPLVLVSSSLNTSDLVRVRRDDNTVEGGTVHDDRKVVCYYANWAVYRQGDAKFTPQNINPYLCTHLIYAFGGLGKDDTIQPFDSYQDIEKGGYGSFAALKTYNKELKTMLAIGGWNEGSTRFSPLVEDQDRRRTFIRSAITFLRRYNFDGLDFDWEYPTLRQGGRPQDRANYALLVKEMREAFEKESATTGSPRLLISMAVPASLEYAGQGYDIENLNQNLDFFNLLTYDYHSAQEPAVNHHSPLLRPDNWSEFDFRRDLNIDSTIKFYVEHGASRHKLVLGIPTYGRSYTLANPDAHEIGSPTTGPGKQGPGTKEDGYLAYYEICVNIIEDGWSIGNPYPGVMGPYAHKGDQWVGFDNVDIAVEKAFYAAEEGLGGIMFWTIDNDDFRGTCSKTPYPLIESAKEAMFSIKSDIKTKTSVSVSTSEQTSRTRLRLTQEELAVLNKSSEKGSKTAKSLNRPPPPPPSRGAGGTPSTSTTPAPPTTPSSGPAFECKGEGFQPHTTSCKKYYWCLDTPSQGLVAHTFTCPRGLFFNSITDGCDFRRNVECGEKEDIETEPDQDAINDQDTVGADQGSTDDVDDDSVEDPKSLRDILELVKAAGGVEGLERQIQEELDQKVEEEERRVRISSKTRNRLTQLLNKGKQDSASESEPERDDSPVSSPPSTTTPAPAPARPSFLSRLASKRRTLPTLTPTVTPAPESPESNPTPESDPNLDSNSNLESDPTPESNPSPSLTESTTAGISSLFRTRSRFRPQLSSDRETTTTSTHSPVTIQNLRSRFRFQSRSNSLFNRPSSSTQSPEIPETPKILESSESPESPVTPEPLETLDSTGLPDTESEEGGAKIQIIGAHVEEEEEEPQSLRPGVFKPKEGVRERLRETLQSVLVDEQQRRAEDKVEDREDESGTIKPFSTPTISKNTRLDDALKSRTHPSRVVGHRQTEDNIEDNRYVTVDRVRATSPRSDETDLGELNLDPEQGLDEENQVGQHALDDLDNLDLHIHKLRRFSRLKRDLNIIYPSNSNDAFPSKSSPSSSSSSSSPFSSPYSPSSYSSYSPSSPYSPTPIPELSNSELLNEISYVYPESYSVQDNPIQPFSSTSLQPVPMFSEESVSSDPTPETLNPVYPTLEPVDPTLHPVDITLDTIDPIDNSNPFDPTLDPVFSSQPDEQQEIFARSSNVPESTSTPETANTSTEADEYDYENWSVVVNVIKSVSDSATSVTLSSDSIEYKTLSSDPTDDSTRSKFDTDTTATPVTEVYSPATESSSETAPIPFTASQEEETIQEVDEKEEIVSEINLFSARTRFGEKRPGLFNLQHHAESPEIKNKTLAKPIHPFFNQIRSSSHNPRNISKFFNSTTISPFTLGSTASSSTSTSLAPSTATSRASLFGRFSRNRFNPFSTSGEKSSPVTEESTEVSEASEETEPENLTELSTEYPAPNTTPATTEREETKSKLLKNLKSRLSNFKRPRPFSRNSITQTKEKEEEDEKENSKEITEEENNITEDVDEEEDTADLNTIEDLVDKPKPSSVTSLPRRPSFIRPSLNSLTPLEFKVPVSSPVEKPRPKRLPAPFSGSRSSLFSNRFKSRPEIASEPVRAEPIRTELVQDDTNERNLDKQSVGDLIAQLNQDENIDESSATLRPRAFKPKSGVSNKIREKLQAELSKDGEEENQNEEDMEEEEKDILTVQSSTEAETSGRVLPARRRVFSRLEISSTSPPPVFNSAISRFRTRQRLQSSQISPSSSSSFSSSSSPAPIVSITDTTEEILYSTDILDISDQTIDTTEVQETTVDIMHVGDIDSLITTIPSFQVSDSQDSVMELSTDPSPTLYQVLVLATQTTLTTDGDATTAPDVESTPDTMEPVPFTAPAFLPTVDQTVFLPTLSRDSEPSSSFASSITTPETILTSTQPSRSRSRARVRGNLHTVQANNVQTGDQPRQASEIRTPVRFRARVRTQPISESTENTENTKLSEIPRSSGSSSHSPRRFISQTNSFDSTPEFKSGRKRLNQNLKVRGRGRSTAAPELLETTTPEAEPELRNIEEPVVKPARGKGKVGKDVVSTAEENIYTGKLQVDSPVTVVSTDQELDSDVSTSRTRGFTPKFGDATRNKLREKLLQELNKTREFGAKEESTEMPLNIEEEDEYRIIDEVNDKPREERNGGFRPTPHSILRPRAHKRPNLDFSRSEDYQDPRLKRQNDDVFVTEASFSFLRRAGRSTLGNQWFTENPLKLQDLEESSVTSLIQDKDFNPTGIKPFLLRGGKGERNLFSSRYSEETEPIEKSSKPDIYLKFNSVPQKESLLKTKPFKKFNPKLEFGSKMLKELVESGSGQVLPGDKLSGEEEENTSGFLPTLPSNTENRDISTSQPDIQTPEETDIQTTTSRDIQTTTFRDLETTLPTENSLEYADNDVDDVDNVNDEISPDSIVISTTVSAPVSRGPQSTQLPTRSRDRSFFSRNQARRRPDSRVETTTQETRQVEPRREEPRRLDGFQIIPQNGLDEVRLGQQEEEKELTPEQALFRVVQENLRNPEPALEIPSGRSRSRAETSTRIPVLNIAEPRPSLDTIPVQETAFAPVAPSTRSKPRLRGSTRGEFGDVERVVPTSGSTGDSEYEYYYDYIEDGEESGHNTEYDLVPLANKVRILDDGSPHCLDVGVFPHPFSCKQFINCFRNPGTGIVGSVYKCPSYLAFDPVGGRCNWVSEIVCSSNSG